jgi:hypothetical protein
MYRQLYMSSCACSLSSNPIDLYTVITCEYWQTKRGMTALLWASEGGHAETVRVLVELGASVEAVDEVNIHAHALANTGCIRHVSGIMRMIIIMSHAYACVFVYMDSCGYVCIYIFVCMYICIYPDIYSCIYIYACIYVYIYIHVHIHLDSTV